MTNLIGLAVATVVLVIIVGATLPIIADSFLGFNESASNITGATASVAKVVPIIFIVGVLVTIVVGMGIVKSGGFGS